MSAYFVDKSVIDALVTAADRIHPMSHGKATTLGRVLWRENVFSLAYRYPATETQWANEFARAADYTFEINRLENSAVLDAINEYDYQSCEHPGWEKSASFRFMIALREAYRLRAKEAA